MITYIDKTDTLKNNNIQSHHSKLVNPKMVE